MDPANRLGPQTVVVCWNGDLRHHSIGGEPSFDLVLGRNIDGRITFNYSLARKRKTLGHVGGRQPQSASTPDAAFRHLQRTTTAAALPTAWLAHLNPGQVSRVSQQGVGWYSDADLGVFTRESKAMLHGLEGARIEQGAQRPADDTKTAILPKIKIDPLVEGLLHESRQVHRLTRSDSNLPPRKLLL